MLMLLYTPAELLNPLSYYLLTPCNRNAAVKPERVFPRHLNRDIYLK